MARLEPHASALFLICHDNGFIIDRRCDSGEFSFLTLRHALGWVWPAVAGEELRFGTAHLGETMQRPFVFHIVCLIALFLARPAAADPLIFNYHGWQVDLTNARGAEAPQDMVRAIERQLDIVEHAGLKPQTLQFMRGIRIWADPTRGRFGPGHYGRASGVDLRVKGLDPDKPIILHEFLHAYHDQQLPNGFANQQVQQYFDRAQGLWPPDSYMMSNNREFFAVTASVYLFGDIERPPFSRAQLAMKQPLYYRWLAELFDDGRERR